MKKIIIGIIIFAFVMVFLPLGKSTIQACENLVSLHMGQGYTDYYDPCGNKLNWKLKSTYDADGSPLVMVLIEGAGVSVELSPIGYSIGDRMIFTGSTTFASGIDHRARIDSQPSIDYPGFRWGTGTRLNIHYLLDQPD